MRPPDWSHLLPTVEGATARAWALTTARALNEGASWRALSENARRLALWRLGVPFIHRELLLALLASPASRSLAELGRLVAARDRDALTPLSDAERAEARATGCWERPSLQRPPREGLSVTVMSGLPGSGKDTWLQRRAPGLPVVSLDRLREELGLEPGSTSDALRTEAFARARAHLDARQPFAWNATLLRRRERRDLVRWLERQGALVTLVSLEVSAELQARRNRSRAGAVPPAALERMLARWEPVLPGEAHAERFFENDVACSFDDASVGG